MAIPPKDRFLALLQSTTLNGIDFVELIPADPLSLRVHFINDVVVDEPGITATISGGDRIPAVSVKPIKPADWSADADGRPLLTLHIEGEGDHSNYTLTINSSKLDRYFHQTLFSFFALCPSDFDCATPGPDCGPDDTPLPPIDYLAKDYLSFKRALTDFSAFRYPDWQERSEGDFGMMFLEALSGIADDLSYFQDRVATESTLETATQRRSIVRLARMVDYEPRPATSATGVLACTVASGPLPAGILVSAVTPDGSVIPFEIGTGLADKTNYLVDQRWNGPINPYWWDDSDRCLLAGTTEMYVEGHGHAFYVGQGILIDTAAATTADPSIRQIVHLTEIEELTDFLFGPTDITRIAWGTDDALTDAHNLTRTVLSGNIVPVTQGQRFGESFAIDTPPVSSANMPLAITRTGANSTQDDPAFDYLYSLRTSPLAWLSQSDPNASPTPEIQLVSKPPNDQDWNWVSSLINAGEFEPAFTVEPATWRAIATQTDGSIQYEYDNDQGETVRFGNGIFGELPNTGDVFEVKYRVGAGAAGNVANDTINIVDPAWTGLLLSATNPFPASGGQDRETNEQVRRLAPQAFRARQFRAVRAEDYEKAAEELSWVQQAGTAFRWTGSWLTVFTTADPKAVETVSLNEHIELIHLLNRRRLAGYESYVPDPVFVSIDLLITVCANPDAFQGDVEKGILDRLGNSEKAGRVAGFFFADSFSFGSPLERSRLEAAIQGVFGVAGVLSIKFRRRGFVPNFIELPDVLPLAADQILRIDNDPDFPERGSIQVVVQGGR